MYENSFSDNGNFVSGQIDNCISIATVYELFKEGFEGSAIFPIDEECGSSWIRLLRFFDINKVSSFNSLIVLDTTPYNKDQPKVEKGVVALRTKDEFAPFNPEMVQKMKEELSGSIPLDFKDEIIEIENAKDVAEGKEPRHIHLGKTELGRVISESKGRINGATIQLPTFNYHTNEETTSKIALKNYLAAISTLS